MRGVFFLVSSVWLGLTDAEVETVFRTTDGFTSPWANWHPSEPNDPESTGAIENCVERTGPNGGTWNDNPCSISKVFYCEG